LDIRYWELRNAIERNDGKHSYVLGFLLFSIVESSIRGQAEFLIRQKQGPTSFCWTLFLILQ